MKMNKVKVGAIYSAKVSGSVVPVRVEGTYERTIRRAGKTSWGLGYYATNLVTGRRLQFRSAARIRPANVG